ncbi:hypothetical protein APU90_09755 [Rathayibacter toxicus]|nr:hypothetical protein APU90_09755 [Rathayibacter toxicus]
MASVRQLWCDLLTDEMSAQLPKRKKTRRVNRLVFHLRGYSAATSEPAAGNRHDTKAGEKAVVRIPSISLRRLLTAQITT